MTQIVVETKVTQRCNNLASIINRYDLLTLTSSTANQLTEDFNTFRKLRDLYKDECNTMIITKKDDSIEPTEIKNAQPFRQKSRCSALKITYQLIKTMTSHECGKQTYKLVPMKVTVAYIPA